MTARGLQYYRLYRAGTLITHPCGAVGLKNGFQNSHFKEVGSRKTKNEYICIFFFVGSAMIMENKIVITILEY